MAEKLFVVVFDLDDTLILSAGTYIPLYAEIMEKEGFGRAKIDKWKENWGKSLKDIIASCYPHLSARQVEKAFWCLCQTVHDIKVPPVPGGPQAIERLREKFYLGILTSRTHYARERLVGAGYRLEDFEFIITQADHQFSKPDPKAASPILNWLEKNLINDWCYVDDSLVGLEFADKLKVLCFSVTSGLINREQFLAQKQLAELIFPTIVEAVDYLLKLAETGNDEDVICLRCEDCAKMNGRQCRAEETG